MYKITLADRTNKRILKIGAYADALLFKALGYVIINIERI